MTPAAPPGSAAARRALVEQVMGMPVRVHVRAVEPTRPDLEAGVARRPSRTCARSTRCSARGGPTATCCGCSAASSGEAHPWVAEVAELCLEAEGRTDGLFSAWRRRDGGRLATTRPGWSRAGPSAGSAHLRDVPEIACSIGAGGDLAVGAGRGRSSAAPTWRIGIEDPQQPGSVATVVTVRRGAVATSGAAARGAHVVDPRTGGIGRAGSATVVGPELLWADVWATAAWVDPARAERLMAERDPAYSLLVL